MPTTEQRRAHYDTFVTQIVELCATKPIRNDLQSGRGRPVEDCDRMQPHLIRHIAGYGARRAHYTTAGLISLHRDLDTPYTPDRPRRRAASRDTDPARGHLPGHAPAGPGTADTRAPAGPGGGDTPAPAGTPGQPTPTSVEHAAALRWRSRPNLGAGLALAVNRRGFDESRMTDRLKLLTRLPTSQLHPRLWSLAIHLHARGAARLDFAVLLEDLAWWDDDRPRITTRWRESYFLTLHAHTLDEDD
ncbi:type I-E CRISPR-associated protein Cse2/CasB [Streptomyces sp. NPDC058049]|uniref:type I-E CRISPR-associated protein Cse2/CasB n=1 Tax=Streptomyces sp. NPDC058049 TaxID=3346314 RepID=UPI0036EA484F